MWRAPLLTPSADVRNAALQFLCLSSTCFSPSPSPSGTDTDSLAAAETSIVTILQACVTTQSARLRASLRRQLTPLLAWGPFSRRPRLHDVLVSTLAWFFRPEPATGTATATDEAANAALPTRYFFFLSFIGFSPLTISGILG